MENKNYPYFASRKSEPNPKPMSASAPPGDQDGSIPRHFSSHVTHRSILIGPLAKLQRSEVIVAAELLQKLRESTNHSQNITKLNQPCLTSSSRGRSPWIFYHPSCESRRVACLISRICPIVLESFDLHLRHSGGTSFSSPWKMKSDVRKTRGFLFFITFYVESKLEWSFYGQ